MAQGAYKPAWPMGLNPALLGGGSAVGSAVGSADNQNQQLAALLKGSHSKSSEGKDEKGAGIDSRNPANNPGSASRESLLKAMVGLSSLSAAGDPAKEEAGRSRAKPTNSPKPTQKSS